MVAIQVLGLQAAQEPVFSVLAVLLLAVVAHILTLLATPRPNVFALVAPAHILAQQAAPEPFFSVVVRCMVVAIHILALQDLPGPFALVLATHRRAIAILRLVWASHETCDLAAHVRSSPRSYSSPILPEEF